MDITARTEFLKKRAAIPEIAYNLVKPAIMNLLETMAKRKHLHIVMMDPRIKPWDGFTFENAIAAEFSIGDLTEWEYDYKTIARSKARQAWRDQRPNLISQMMAPATMKRGDTFYFGSFEYYGAIVAASGVESHFDVLVSGWLAVAYQQVTQHHIQLYREVCPDEDYLP